MTISVRAPADAHPEGRHEHGARTRGGGHRRLPSRSQFRRRLSPYLFILPFVAVFAAFSVYPLVFTLQLSFTNWQGGDNADWVGLGNYRYLLSSPEFWSSLGISGLMWLLVVPLQLVVGVVAAVLLNGARTRARGFYRVSFIVPFVTPLVAVAQIWVVVFDQNYGAVNAVLRALHLPSVAWLTSTGWARWTLALLFLWKTTGFVVIILLSGLQSIDGTLYEAAQIDGASRLRQLMSLTIPLIRRTLAFVLVLQTLAVFQMFAEPYVVTKGGPYGATTTAGYYLYSHITNSDLGTGAANSLLLVVLVMALSLLAVRVLRSDD